MRVVLKSEWQPRFARLAPVGMVDRGIHVRIETVGLRILLLPRVVGGRSTKRSFTIDLMLLNPYFHGTTSRIGAPF